MSRQPWLRGRTATDDARHGSKSRRPLKTNLEPTKWRLGIWISFWKGWFSGSMLVFGTVLVATIQHLLEIIKYTKSMPTCLRIEYILFLDFRRIKTITLYVVQDGKRWYYRYTYLDLPVWVPNGSVADLSMHHPSEFNWHPLEVAGRYIYIEPKSPLSLKVNTPKQGLFQSKQESFGF